MHERASCREALYLEPFAKPFNPVVTWQALLRHTEAMTTFGVGMQLGSPSVIRDVAQRPPAPGH
jgi:hypothetical protein